MAEISPKVSIIIVNYNGKNETLECLESFYKIDYLNFEVVVVDNASTDGSVEAIKTKFPQAVLIINQENLGFCIANNIAFRHAKLSKARYLLVINNDSIVESSIIKELRAALDSDSQIAGISPLIAYYSKPNVVQFCGSVIDWSGAVYLGHHQGETWPQSGLLHEEMLSFGAVLFKVEMLNIVGELDEDLFVYYEDMDWTVRARRKGLKTVLYPKVLVYHKASASSGGEYSPFFHFYFYRNRLIFMRKRAWLLRKLQFSFIYIRDCLRKSAQLSSAGQEASGQAVADALWSSLHGCVHNQRLTMPENIRKHAGFIVRARLWRLALKGLVSG